MSMPTTVEDVITRMRTIDAGLVAGDGVRVFNRMYLTVTERIAQILAGSADTTFRDAPTMAELDVRFANLWLAAYDASVAGRVVPAAWRPLFEARERSCLPIQFALAGMNTHIEHDLPIAVVDTCRSRRLDPDDVQRDYQAVNEVLADVEAGVRRSFLDSLGQEIDDHVGPVVHLVSSWNIDKARDVSWITAETIWALRHTDFLRGRFLVGLGHSVGMTSRALLTPRT
ncbi:conserved hypothetical protein [metagenome]|uniref:Uncharacterized protein n=1 Tax=metagenome TaxID=256318 RepID=A0A2P2CBL1_9ZZZZ